MLSRGDFREYDVGRREGGIPAYAGMTGGVRDMTGGEWWIRRGMGGGNDGRGCGI